MMTERSEVDALVNRLVHATDAEEKRAIYQQWAHSYDADLDDMGYVAPEHVVDIIQANLPDRDAAIHDAGCGTGRVGVRLAAAGYRQIDGADYSSEMRLLAQQSGAYQTVTHADFSAPLAMPDACRDAVVSVGVYSNEFRTHFLPELLRILRPGGLLVCSCRPLWFDDGMEKDIAILRDSGRIKVRLQERRTYMLAQDADAWFLCIEKCKENI
jgi:predicted TPR repeat methyltransferase